MARYQRARIVRIAAFVIVALFLVYRYSSPSDTQASSDARSPSIADSGDYKVYEGSDQLSQDYPKQDTSSSSSSSSGTNRGGESAHQEFASPEASPSREGTSPKPETTIPGQYERENATFVSLVRNSDLKEIAKSVRIIEDRFNRHYHYDWVFLNDKEFDDNFIKVTTALVSGKAKYGLIGSAQWGYPDYIDQDKAAAARKQMAQDGIIYGDSVSYRHMCRYESGFFFRHELMLDYQYYWRVEPSIDIACDVPYDIFKFMRNKDIKYGFTISLPEYPATIATLWETVKNFTKLHPEYLAKDNLMDWISYDQGETYNGCHFWSNFEVANMDLWRSEAYLNFFDFLDKSGGFFYERWGDAPVHSIAASLFLNKNEIHHFENIGYFHPPFTNCPTNEEARLDLKCVCLPSENFAWKGYSCTSRFYEINGLQRPSEWKSQSD